MLYRKKLIELVSDIVADIDYLRKKEIDQDDVLFFLDRDLKRLFGQLKDKDILEIKERVNKIELIPSKPTNKRLSYEAKQIREEMLR